MAFPTIPTVAAGRVLSVTATNPAGTHTSPNLSSLTKNAGDLLIAIVITYDGNSTNAEFSSWGGGFTEFGDFATTATMGIGCAYKWSTGSETGTFTVTSADASANDSAFFLLSIPGAHDSTPPEAGSYSSVLAADPASFNPAGWGTEDTLWIAVAGSGETSTTGSYTGVDGAPANYTDFVVSGISADAVGGVEGAVAFRQLNAASEDVGQFTRDTSNARSSACVIAVRPAAAVPVTVTPTTASLTLATFAPTVAVSDNQSVTPTTASLATATFAPTVAATANWTLTPTTAALATSAFAPTVTATDHKTVTPTTASFATATFAPTVTASDHQTVTPTTAALSLSTFAPDVTATAGLTLTPTTATLTTATFAPSVTATAHQTVTPTTLALSTSLFAPAVTATDHRTVVPSPASLELATFIPSVITFDPQLVTPDTATLALTTFAPAVAAGVRVTPATVALSTATFAPDVLLAGDAVVVPATATLTLTGFPPSTAPPPGIRATIVTVSVVVGSVAPSGVVGVSINPVPSVRGTIEST